MALSPLTAEFAKDPLAFMRLYSVNPPADPDARLRKLRDIDIDDRGVRFFYRKPIIENEMVRLHRRFKSAETVLPIAWISFKNDAAFSGAKTFDLEFAEPKANPTGNTDVSEEFHQRVAAKDRLPVYYLPWLPDHFLRMSIPRYTEENLDDFGLVNAQGRVLYIDPYSPQFFFTAGLTGCSVFVYGDGRQPTVTHIGTNTTTPYGDDAARFWRELLLVERIQRGHHGGEAHEANVDQYMGDLSQRENFKRWLAVQPSEFTVEHVVSFGAVFGIRFGALWSFYLQENAAVVAYKIVNGFKKQTRVQKGLFSFLDETIVENVAVSRRQDHLTTVPMSVRPFFPASTGEARLWQTFRRI